MFAGDFSKVLLKAWRSAGLPCPYQAPLFQNQLLNLHVGFGLLHFHILRFGFAILAAVTSTSSVKQSMSASIFSCGVSSMWELT